MYKKNPANKARAVPKPSPGKVKRLVEAIPSTGATRVHQQPAKRDAPIAVILQHHVHGVDAVGEIVGQHRNGDHESHRMRGLKGQADGDAVEQAVGAKHAGGEWSAGRGVARETAECGPIPGRTGNRARSTTG